MNVPVEIKIYADELYPYFDIAAENSTGYDAEVRVDMMTLTWIKRVMGEFADVQEYLGSIHPDYMER